MREDVSALDDEIRETVNRLLDSLKDRATEAEEQRAHLTAEIEDLQRRLNDSHSQLETTGRELDTTRQELEDARQAIEKGRQEIDSARQETESARQETESARREAESAREDTATTTRDLEGTREQLDTRRQEVEAALRDLESVRRDSDDVRLEVSRLTDALREKDERTMQAARLPDAVRAIDEAGSFGEVLEHLARCAGREAGRAAIFLVKGERLRDWRTVGFNFASDAPRLDIGIDESGPMAEAIRSGEAVYPGRSGEGLPAFARIDDQEGHGNREGAAWPVSVGGSVVAVLYADGFVADKPDEPYWPAFLDVLARYAGRVLEGLTVRQAAGLMTGKASISHASGSIQ